MKTAAAYVRVSTEKQDEYSLDSQLKLIREYAITRDIIVPDEFVFVEDGVSGRSVKGRRAFQNMIALAKDKEHPFDIILVWKYSRFARNQEESILYKSMLARSGVDVISISETLDDSPFASLIERIIEWMDEFYSIRLSGEVKRGMLEKVSRGEIVSRPPFGYDSDGKNYYPNQYAENVKEIFRDFLAGKGMAAMARDLNARQIFTVQGNPFDNRHIKYILANPTYIGKLRWSTDGRLDYRYGHKSDKAVLVDGHFEPLIDLATWEAAQAKLKSISNAMPYTRHEQPVEWMLKGLVRCSNCGATLVYTALKYPSMQCHKYARGQCKTSHSLTIKRANTAVIAALEHCVDTGVFPLAPQHNIKPTEPEKDFAKLIAAEQLKLKRVLAAYEAGVDTLEEYAEKKKKLQAGIDALRAEQAGAAEAARSMPVEDMREKVVSVLDIIKSENVSEEAKNKALRSVLSHIVFEKANSRLALYFLFS